MLNDYGPDYPGIGLILFVIYVVVSLAIVGVLFCIVYSIIWRAVRRGMREFYAGTERPAVHR